MGYWVHTVALVTLFGPGAELFTLAWLDRPAGPYRLAYVIAVTSIAIGVSNVVAPGGFGAAPLLAANLTLIGWLQAPGG